MPGVPNQETAHEALIRVCNEISQAGFGNEEDYAFLKAILQDVVVDGMFQTYERLNKPAEPADHNAKDAVKNLLESLNRVPDDKWDSSLRDLSAILADHDLENVLYAHDDIARKLFDPVQYPMEPEPDLPDASDDGPIRYITINRRPGEPLGITVGNEDNDTDLRIVRIAPGSATEKQGLLHIGDIIAEVNGIPVHTADELGDVIQRSGSSIKFKVIPAGSKGSNANQRYLKAHFSYNPHKDSRIQAPSLGLAFESDDILAIIRDNDKNWWECKNLRTGDTGNVPSPTFEERRRQMSQPPPDKQKSSFLCGMGKKKKQKYEVNPPTKQDQVPAVLYEEVIKVKPFQHKCLVLVGAQGIGRRSIKNKIIQKNPRDFGAPVPNTSRPMRDGEINGKSYYFLSKDEMDDDIKAGKYLEFGELNKNYYGTAFSALKAVISSGKTCIVDPKSAAISKLRNVDWMPYVVFVKPPDAETVKQMNTEAINAGVDTQKKTEEEVRRIMEETQRISRQYIHFCDATINYDSFESACDKILHLLKKADSAAQWVPASWESRLERAAVLE